MSNRSECPWCGRKLIYAHDGIFRWKRCSAVKSCGWSVFEDPSAKPKVAA